MTLNVANLSLTLGDGDQELLVLNEVSLSIKAGEFAALLGPSGSGKSSLLAVCGGLRKASKGSVKIGDSELTTMRPKAMTKLRSERVGFVFQQSNLLPSLTALDQLLLTVHISGRKPNKTDIEKARSLLSDLGLSDRMDRRPGTLSGGEKQRVAIARAIVNQPDLIIADEPTGNLDPINTYDVVQILKKINDLGTTVLLTTHNKGVIDSLGRRVITIDQGRIVRDDKHGRYVL